MSTVYDVRGLRFSRKALIIAAVAVVVALVAGYAGWQLYRKLTTNTIVAYFEQANALYPGDDVAIMGVTVGAIDKVEPAGDKMKVTFHYNNKYKVPADAKAVILNPTLVASRNIQLEPSYDGGPVLADNTVLPIERTQVPVEWDELRDSIGKTVEALGPTPEQPKGPFGDTIESLADGLAGKGQAINTSLNSLSTALTAVNESRGETFAVLRGLATFLNALQISEQQLISLNDNLAQLTSSLTPNDHEVADAVDELNALLPVLRKFLDDNGQVLTTDINNLSEATTPLVQPDQQKALETFLHVFPTFAANANNAYHPSHGSLTIIPAVTNFANPLQLVCSMIQAGSRLGYQDSAELCAQYLTPVLDAIKFNYLPFGLMPFSTAETLPKQVAHSEPRLQPPPGYKDTTVPGIFSPDTLFSHGNYEPGWIAAPGMQGVQVRPRTADLLTPQSLTELMGGPDAAPPPTGQNLAGPPNAYDENNPLPPPWYPQPGPPPPPGPDVIPGPVAPTPASSPLPHGTPPPAAAPPGPPLPAEAPIGPGQ
ncbi:virulence factor Mce family protein [Mycolicibacterium sp. jd]|uniref:Virulence factor Mce family protein n=1 Tax=Mycolicibacterium austroafricanum TaxID=39687 RepID=A0ABT8HM62_MYCAO|nr:MULTISPECIES: virulence factor Mce family protein [Mycolicibacterium]MDN4521845.1 virulence factor Mce family protein [Mycolicibacterium austroafricanum]UJL30594.1 virulence factor Mce family protein [Mycolicibacterium vanbaalenii]WND56300.1 virulence factor Mce family protein [Mycolicibacterium vanbaalenii]